MKLYNVVFDAPQDFALVRAAAKEGDSNAIVAVNDGYENKLFEVQSEKAASAIVAKLGGRIEIIEYNITDMYKK